MLQKHGYMMLSNIDFTHGILEAAQCFSPVVFTSSDATVSLFTTKEVYTFWDLIKAGDTAIWRHQRD